MNRQDESQTDDDLILALQQVGRERERAVDALYRRFSASFKGRLLRSGFDLSDAEDVIQDTFIKIIRSADHFQPQGEGAAWLWRIFHSVHTDAARKRGRLPEMTEISLVPELDSGETVDAVCQLEFQRCVKDCLDTLGKQWPDGLQAIIWSAEHGLKTKQIAEIIQRSDGATREFLSQVRKRFKQLVEPCRALL